MILKTEWLLKFSSGHITVEIVYLIILFCIVMTARSWCQLATAGKFHLPSSL